MLDNRGRRENKPTSGTSRSGVRPWLGTQPRVEIPSHAGYRIISHERLRYGQLSMVGLLLIPLWFVVYVLLVRAFGGPDVYSGEISIMRAVYTVLVLTAVIALHEGIHAVAGLVFRVRPYFGVGPGYFFVTFFQPFRKVGFLSIALAPLVIISAGSVAIGVAWPAAAGWVLVGSLFNMSGSGGDLWMAKRILIRPRDAIFYDLADGFAVFTPDRN